MISLNERLYFARRERRAIERLRQRIAFEWPRRFRCPFDLPIIYWDGR